MSSNLKNSLEKFFPPPINSDIDNISIYNSVLRNRNIRLLTRLTYQVLQVFYGNTQKTVKCCITGKYLLIYNDYPIIDGIFMLSSRTYKEVSHTIISRKQKLYPISTDGLLLVGESISNKCKNGRIYREGILLRFLGTERHSIYNEIKEAQKKYKSIISIQNFYRMVCKTYIKKRDKLLNESLCKVEKKDVDTRLYVIDKNKSCTIC